VLEHRKDKASRAWYCQSPQNIRDPLSLQRKLQATKNEYRSEVTTRSESARDEEERLKNLARRTQSSSVQTQVQAQGQDQGQGQGGGGTGQVAVPPQQTEMKRPVRPITHRGGSIMETTGNFYSGSDDDEDADQPGLVDLTKRAPTLRDSDGNDVNIPSTGIRVGSVTSCSADADPDRVKPSVSTSADSSKDQKKSTPYSVSSSADSDPDRKSTTSTASSSADSNPGRKKGKFDPELGALVKESIDKDARCVVTTHSKKEDAVAGTIAKLQSGTDKKKATSMDKVADALGALVQAKLPPKQTAKPLITNTYKSSTEFFKSPKVLLPDQYLQSMAADFLLVDLHLTTEAELIADYKIPKRYAKRIVSHRDEFDK